MRSRSPILASVLLGLLGCGNGSVSSGGGGGTIDPPQGDCAPHDTGPLFYVSTNGDDDADGTEANPWASIGHAITQIPDGATLLVGPGTYSGRIRLDSQFDDGVVIRSNPSYQAKLRNDGTVIAVYEGQGITISGFDISHDGPGAGALVIQIQDLIGEPGGEDAVSRITLHNNIIHDSYNNDILKINNGAREIIVENNIFYNQEGNDEHIDVNSVGDIVIQDNIFFNDFEASGRDIGEDTSSFIVIKDSNGDDDSYEGAEHIKVRRNILLNWQGTNGTNFLLVGEDGNPYHEAFDVLFENNLLVGNSDVEVRAPLGIKGGRDIQFIHNTIVGNMPGDAFAFRFNQEGDNPPNQDITLYNNIWSDPSGTMGDFSDTPRGETESFELDNNLYWNGGSDISQESSDMINRDDDASGLDVDPLLEEGNGILPTWNEQAARFEDNSGDICAAFEKLVAAYGTPSASSPVIGAARSDKSPAMDILGNPRSGDTCIGAVEVQ